MSGTVETPTRRPIRLTEAELPTARRSKAIVRFMTAYFERFFARHMNALRLARWGRPDIPAGAGPLVVYSNHPAWWDAAVYVLAGSRLFKDYESYAPIDAAMLAKYGVFGRMGAFGVDLGSPRGAASFLAAAADILARPNRLLWMTAQGRFVDVRERPLGLRPGIAHLPGIAPNALLLPLAIEYAFWTERGAEACIAFGQPMPARDLLELPRPRRLDRLEAELTATLDRLSADVQARDPARFESLLEGKAGIGGIYDGWRRFAATLRGRGFDPAHERRIR